MSDESREKLELKVECSGGWGLIQCEADGRTNGMALVVRKLAAAFPYPLARPTGGTPPTSGGSGANEYEAMVEEVAAVRCRDESSLDALKRALMERGALREKLEPLRCAGEPDHTGALSRLIAENKSLKEDGAWVEQSVRLILESENISLTVKAGSNLPEAVGVLLEERKHLSTLLEESGFPHGFRGAYTLFARMQELVVAWREKHQSEVAQRMEDAAETMGDTIRDRLLAILFPGQPAPSLDLEGCLRDVDSRLNRNRPPLGNPPPYIVRDAALEEAAGGVDLTGLADWAKGLVRERIRALKSKHTPQPSKNPGESQQATPTWEPDSPTDLPDEEQPQSGLVQLAVGPTDRDFGWALQQMRAGKKVRRRVWEYAYFYRFTGKRIEDESGVSAVVHWENILATDWEVAE